MIFDYSSEGGQRKCGLRVTGEDILNFSLPTHPFIALLKQNKNQEEMLVKTVFCSGYLEPTKFSRLCNLNFKYLFMYACAAVYLHRHREN